MTNRNVGQVSVGDAQKTAPRETPIRMQLSRRKGFDLQQASRAVNGLVCVKVDRATGFGNPYPITNPKPVSGQEAREPWVVGTWSGPHMWICESPEKAADISVRAFRAWIEQQPALLKRVQTELAGKNLACWCSLRPGTPCHADVLLELANEPAADGAPSRQLGDSGTNTK